MSKHPTGAQKDVNKKTEQNSVITDLKAELKTKGKTRQQLAKVGTGSGGGLYSSPVVGDESVPTIKTIKQAVSEGPRSGHMLKAESKDSKTGGVGSSATTSSPEASNTTAARGEGKNVKKNPNKTDSAPKSQQKDQQNQKDSPKDQGDLPQAPPQKLIKNTPNKIDATPKFQQQNQQNLKDSSKDQAPSQNLKGGKNTKAGGQEAVAGLLKGSAPPPNSTIVGSSTVAGASNKQLQESVTQSKSVVRESLTKLKMVLDNELNAKAGASASNTGSVTVRETEDPLDRKQYSEEGDLEQRQAKKAQEVEQCLIWMDKALNLALFNISILVLIAALMTAFGCYIFVQLPFVVYSVHVLTEVFLISDLLIEENGFSHPATLRIVCPLPLVILIMYGTILFSIYLTEYPKRSKCLIYTRNCVFIFLESYFLVTALCYGIELIHVKDRLSAFHMKDLKGITVSKNVFAHYESPRPVPLYFLNRSQEYFGCCGFYDKAEWQKTHPSKYKGKNSTWPLSCCDEKRSGIACYGPVEETVTYTRRNDEDSDKPDEFTTSTENRLYESNCFSKEEMLTTAVISMICFLTVAFMLLSTWNVIIFIKLSRLCIEKNLEPREKEQYIDFF